jgi:hypothetical protein
MEKIITYFGQKIKVKCDEKCNKAWGTNKRPRIYPEISNDKIFGLNNKSVYPNKENIDLDHYAYCSDGELQESPIDPGTYEGDDAKPTNKNEIGNKWCVRECERCVMSEPGKHNKQLKLIDFNKRYYNIDKYNS